MNLKLSYLGRSGLIRAGTNRILQMAPNLDRDEVAFDAPLNSPLRFREAMSALHDVVINDLTFQPRDKSAYQQWKADQVLRERAIAEKGRQAMQKEIERNQGNKPSAQLKRNYNRALKRYWKSRRELNSHLRKQNEELWRKLMPYDPVITVADDVLMFECFSTDESSYGCLTVDRDSFGYSSGVKLGTTNVDYSWELYENFQALRTYRETRFNINPEGFHVRTESHGDYHEEKIELPDGWLRGFMQLQAAMGLPMRRVPVSVGAIYSLLAFFKRNKARKSPRAIRFELADGKSPRLVLEPWEQPIDSLGTTYAGPTDEPIRIWGRRRLLTLARILPLVERFDVYLLGTGLPSFWVARMGDMRLTLGLSGWTTNDWTRGSAVQMLMPRSAPNDALVAKSAESLINFRKRGLKDLAGNLHVDASEMAGALNQLALRGQVIYDLDAGAFRWRQVMPMAVSEKEMGPPHPETAGAEELIAQRKVKIESSVESPRGGWIVTGDAGGKPCEALLNADGLIRKGKCLCSWHYKFGIRNGPCRHIQAIRDVVWLRETSPDDDWYTQRLKWTGQSV